MNTCDSNGGKVNQHNGLAIMDVALDRGGTLTYRDGAGRMIVGDDFDGRAGADWVGATKSERDLPEKRWDRDG